MEPPQGGLTTVAIYRGDLDWLKKRQLAASERNGGWMHMADVTHALIEFAKQKLAEEAGD